MRSRVLQRVHDDGGAVAVMVALLSTVLVGFAAIAVDIAREYAVAAELQKAADAGALAGAVYLPSNVVKAQDVAEETVLANLYGASASDVTILPVVGARPTQLRVSVSRSVPFAFGGVLGIPTGTVTRAATADFAGPIPMGSPCNLFGNELMEKNNNRIASSNCTTNTGTYWLNIAGPAINKARGDNYAASWCGAPDDGTYNTIDGCKPASWSVPGTNADYVSNVTTSGAAKGYVYILRLKDTSSATSAVTLNPQMYDGSWVYTGDQCAQMPDLSGVTNVYVNGADAATRYKNGLSAFCSGDSLSTDNPQNGNGSKPVTTTFTVRGPIDSSGDPLGAPTICTRTLTGWDSNDASFATLLRGNNDASRTFHRWDSICPGGGFAANRNADYSVQIQTTINGVAQGAGQNRMGLRASLSSANTNVSIFGAGRFSMYYNTPAGDSQFNLVRLGSSAAGKTLKVGFFDFGDLSNSSVDITLNKPDNSSLGTGGPGHPLASCTASKDPSTASGVATGALANCTVPNITSGVYGGHFVYVSIPIPSSYKCTPEVNGDPDADAKCWITVNLNVTATGSNPSSSDTTTINAGLSGDPVRLVP